jgi:hypothetical protein
VRLIARQIRLGLLEGSLEGARVQLRNQAARMHGLTFDEADLVDCAGYLRVNVDNVVRLDRANSGHHDWHVRDLNLCGDDWDRR